MKHFKSVQYKAREASGSGSIPRDGSVGITRGFWNGEVQACGSMLYNARAIAAARPRRPHPPALVPSSVAIGSFPQPAGVPGSLPSRDTFRPGFLQDGKLPGTGPTLRRTFRQWFPRQGPRATCWDTGRASRTSVSFHPNL